MTFLQFIKDINNIEDYDLSEGFNYDYLTQLKYDLDDKLDNEDICFKNISYNIVSVFESTKEVKIDKDVIKSKLGSCRYIYLILAITWKCGCNHALSLIIDNKEKKCILFDNAKTDTTISVSKIILTRLDLNYKLIYSNAYDKKLDKCGVCLPLSYLFIYVYIKYNVKLDTFIKFINNQRIEDNTHLMYKFIKYLTTK